MATPKKVSKNANQNTSLEQNENIESTSVQNSSENYTPTVSYYHQTKAFAKKHTLELILIILTSSLLISGLAFLGLSGNYRNFLNTSVSGQVVDENGKPVESAQLKIEDKDANTNKDGLFSFASVPLSSPKITITSQQHFYFEQKLELRNRPNEGQRFTLKTLDYSSVSGKLEGKDLVLGKTKVKINKTEVPLNSDFSFKLEKSVVGQASLSITSDDHKDVLKQVNLLPGINDLGTFKMELGDLSSFRVSSWANSASLKNAEVVIGNITLKTDDLGNFSFRMKKGEKYSALIKNPGFVSKSFDLNDDTKQLELVPEGKIVYTSDRNGKNAIYISNFDGSEEAKIYETSELIRDAMIYENQIYFFQVSEDAPWRGQDTQQAYKINLDGSKNTKLSNINPFEYSPELQTFQTISLNYKKIITYSIENKQNVSNQTKVSISNIDGSNKQQIRDRLFKFPDAEEVRDIVVSPRGDKIAYVITRLLYRNDGWGYDQKQTRILSVNTDGSNPTDLFTYTLKEGEYSFDGGTIVGYSPDSKYLLYRHGNKLYIHNLEDNKARFVTETSTILVENGAQFDLANNRFYFIDIRDSKYSLFFYDLNLSEVFKISGTESGANEMPRFYIEPKFGGIYFNKEGKTYLIRPGKEVVELPIASNYKMWARPMIDYRYF
jgi:hypothetical protein